MIPIDLKGTSELVDGTLKGTFIFSDEFEEAFIALKRKAKKENTKLAIVAVKVDNAEVRPVYPDILSGIRDYLEKGIEIIDKETGEEGRFVKVTAPECKDCSRQKELEEKVQATIEKAAQEAPEQTFAKRAKEILNNVHDDIKEIVETPFGTEVANGQS